MWKTHFQVIDIDSDFSRRPWKWQNLRISCNFIGRFCYGLPVSWDLIFFNMTLSLCFLFLPLACLPFYGENPFPGCKYWFWLLQKALKMARCAKSSSYLALPFPIKMFFPAFKGVAFFSGKSFSSDFFYFVETVWPILKMNHYLLGFLLTCIQNIFTKSQTSTF